MEEKMETIFCVFDDLSKRASPPFFADNDDVAVRQECGELLSTYADIKVLDDGKQKSGGKKNVVEPAGKK